MTYSRGFPQLSSCGPIEGGGNVARVGSGIRAFRNCQVAAPLKAIHVGALPPVPVPFPQLSSCGPIEGAPPAIPPWPACTFRNCQVAAPLKGSPEPTPKGPVLPFRNCQVAAPLKVVVGVEYEHGVGAFPQLSSCGPIEGPRGGHGARSLCAFRNCQVAAPLKVAARRVRWIRQELSATVKLRPH